MAPQKYNSEIQMKDKLMIYSDSETEEFAKNFSDNVVSRERYNSFLPLFRKGIPYFLSNSTARHHYDLRNIERILRRERINKDSLSLIIFDAHTDMYRDIEKGTLTENKVNMANWVLNILERGYSDISIVGVSDFTRTKGALTYEEYLEYCGEVSFFTGNDFKIEKDFKGLNNEEQEIILNPLEKFINKKFRKNSFISLDCDVSFEFSDMNPKYVGYKGAMKIHEILKTIDLIKQKSSLVGFSLYGMWDTFCHKTDEVREVLDSV